MSPYAPGAALRLWLFRRPAPTLVALGLVALSGCRSDSAAATASRSASSVDDARVAELFFTTGLAGHVEPCGCTSKPLGGLPKLATVVEGSQAPHALIDAGQLFLPTGGIDEVTRPQHRAKASVIARAFRKLDVAAINLAASDLAEGVGLIEELQREGAVPLVSANVRPREASGPEVARSYVRVVGEVRLGITGVTIPERVQAATRDVTALEFAPALKAEVASLREAGVDVVVVLAHLPEADARALAEAVPAMDLLVRAPGTPIERAPRPPFRVGPVIIAEAGQQGQHVGRARFVLGPKAPPRPLPLDDAGSKARDRRARLERRVEALEKEMARFADDPSRAEVVAARRRVKERLEARLAAPASPPSPPEGPHVEITIIPLEPSVDDDREMEKLLAVYVQTLRAMNAKRSDPRECELEAEGAPRFVGNETCASCHEEAVGFWEKTKHAEAWETLEAEGKHYDFTCVGCHTVGFRTPGGFCSLEDAEPFRDVGCESCHGPGSAHAAAPVPGSIDRAAREASCTAGCHVPEHSDTFVYETYVRRITGPGHPRGEASE